MGTTLYLIDKLLSFRCGRLPSEGDTAIFGLNVQLLLKPEKFDAGNVGTMAYKPSTTNQRLVFLKADIPGYQCISIHD